MKKVVYLILIFTFSLSMATAQEVIIAAGIDVTGNGGSVSYSVGQVVYQIHNGTDGSLAEGVQQPYRPVVTYIIENGKRLHLSFIAFPNPVTDNLDLKIENYDNENLSYQVVDMQGKIFHNQKITGNHTRIIMGNLPRATYFVNVVLDNNLVKTFKIIKS